MNKQKKGLDKSRFRKFHWHFLSCQNYCVCELLEMVWTLNIFSRCLGWWPEVAHGLWSPESFWPTWLEHNRGPGPLEHNLNCALVASRRRSEGQKDCTQPPWPSECLLDALKKITYWFFFFFKAEVIVCPLKALESFLKVGEVSLALRTCSGCFLWLLFLRYLFLYI